MSKRVHYFFWKKRAKKAVVLGQITSCVACDDPIVPGDFVGICHVGDDPAKKLIHAGFHFSLSEMDAFCETGAIGCAFWDGEKAVGIGESMAATAIRTGKPQVM